MESWRVADVTARSLREITAFELGNDRFDNWRRERFGHWNPMRHCNLQKIDCPQCRACRERRRCLPDIARWA